MKKLLSFLTLMAVAVTMMAVPAKRGQWKTLTLADGTQVSATLVGDEHGHYWLTADGKAYTQQGDDQYFQPVDFKAVSERAKARRAKVNARRVQKRAFGHPTTILGPKKAIMILVNFKDKKFLTAHNNELYQDIANKEGYSEGNFKGSMADYFKAQSRGKFELNFDVVGPVTVSNNYSYYGKNDSQGNDKYPAKMVCEAVELAKNEIEDWTPYDWDGDGYVDQVYLVYAGKGEADGGAANTIWPHAYELSTAKYFGDGSGPVSVGTNLYVNSYACGSELNGYSGTIAGIGTMCHEYSHCLGYPDFYDTDYSGGQGMGSWDLMDQGSYNDNGFQPAGYTSYERWFAGWETPIELKDQNVEVSDMKSLQNDGEFYIIYNDNNADEFYLLENRQKDGWDASLPYAGLLIIHVDYNASAWESNGPNDTPSHQRMTVVPADGKYSYQMYMGEKYYDDAEPFPYKTVTAFNKDFKTSETQAKKAAQFFTKTSNGTYWMDGSVEDITQNAGGTMSFKYVIEKTEDPDPENPENPDPENPDPENPDNPDPENPDNPDPDDPAVVDPTVVDPELPEGTLLSATFDNLKGTGGNDGQWSGAIAVKKLEDLAEAGMPGWSAENAFAGYQCIKLGKSGVAGAITSPAIAVDGTATLKFRAGAWNAKSDGTTLYLMVDNGTVYPEIVFMTKGAFADYEATITATGDVKISLQTESGRFFLDDVVVNSSSETTAIRTVQGDTSAATRYYTLDGRFAGTDYTLLRRGLYLVGGKKIVK